MTQHVSVRVPWTDNKFCGQICNHPCANTSCLRLKNIIENKLDIKEESIAGEKMSATAYIPPCIAEGGAFMAPFQIERLVEHPYKENGTPTHRHFLPTKLIYPPYSLPGRPFGWTMLHKEGEPPLHNINQLIKKYNINYDQKKEPNLMFETNWVQSAENQRAIFKKFYENVIPNKSLVIPYAKQVPFVEDSRRVILGVGFIQNIIQPPEYNHTNENPLRSILWETMLEHSIRPNRKNGFLMPYNEMEQYANKHPEFDMRSITIFAENEFFDEFSYATEHLSYDAVINVLIQIIHALNIIKNCIPGNWDECIEWTKNRLKEAKQERGVYPGIGTMLNTMQFKEGYAIAEILKQNLQPTEDWFDKLTKIIQSPQNYLPPEISHSITKTEQQAFLSLSGNRREFFKLLSRFSISLRKTELLFNQRCYKYVDEKLKFEPAPRLFYPCNEKYYLENPYLIYENTRLLSEDLQVSLREVDIAVFSQDEYQSAYLTDANDQNRIRALIISILEDKATQGNTIYPRSLVLQELNKMPLSPPCFVTKDILNGIEPHFESEITLISISENDEEIAYKLNRIDEFDSAIRKMVKNRITKGTRHNIEENWEKIVNEAFAASPNTEFEQKARQEKIAVLKELASSRLSVLIGGAGTGKTTLLSLFCKSKKISQNKILLLAPTGKSRVRMTQAMQAQGIRFEAKTVSQFLLENHCFDFQTMRYTIEDITSREGFETVIIDESSMLTEEMFGALANVLKNSSRVIFVGDPNQLPPIGAGRPFVDLVNYLKPNKYCFPYIGQGFGALTIPRRQINEKNERADLMLSEWFTSYDTELNNGIFDAIEDGLYSKNIIFKKWNSAEELQQLILQTISKETGMEDINDLDTFDRSLGGVNNGKWMNFGENIAMIEQWQILSPLKNNTIIGTSTINRIIHERFRSHVEENHVKGAFKKRTTKKILGTDGIMFGDKVINIRNQKLYGTPKTGYLNYVANGEVGLVCNFDKENNHIVKFSSQPNYNYSFYPEISDNHESDLELAYALTIHKAQGSEFKKVILILSDFCQMLSKELLYTAITRQTEKLVILFNNSLRCLRAYSSAENSSVCMRLTNLFSTPTPIEHNQKYYENSLIHRTARGEFVRSKSEVIIANSLYHHDIPYKYEQPLILTNGKQLLPDFTINDMESGRIYYWEHCGMLDNPTYRERWEAKKELYLKNGIQEGIDLLVSEDHNGAIDTKEIEHLINKYLI